MAKLTIKNSPATGAAQYVYHKDHTEPKGKSDVFVFGSNLRGHHGGGAALLAQQKYQAVYGHAEGMTGRSYAIPTKDAHIETLPLSEIKSAVKRFIKHVKENPETTFFMTRIGCVLAGYSDAQIGPMFKGAPTNINFPEEWKQYVEAA